MANNTISESYVLPLVSITVDGSQAGNLTEDQPALLVGQMFSTGIAAVNVPTPIGSPSVAKRLFGDGSVLERMVAAFYLNNTTQNLWCLPLPDPVAGVAATGAVTVTSAPTAADVVNLYIAGQKVACTAYSTDTISTIAARIAATINALTTLPVTAVATAGAVALTSKFKGDLSNDAQISFNYLGLYGNEEFPAGFAATITPMSGGAGQPDLSAGIAAIESKIFSHVALPYSDTASLNAFDAEYGFGPNGRWDFTRMQYGIVYNAVRFDYPDALEWGEAHNSAVISTMAIEPTFASAVYEVSAAYAANASYALLIDAARPLQTLTLRGLLPAPIQDRFSKSERNVLAGNGLAIQNVNSNELSAIEREVLQYQFNAYGQRDTAFNLVTILSTLAEINNRVTQALTSKYPRHMLGNDGDKFGAGKAVVTPTILKAELVSEATQMAKDALISNLPDFIANLIVERDDTNPNRVNVLYAPQLMGQLRQMDIVNQFRLLYQDNLA